MLSVIQRLALPIILLVAFIAAIVAADQVGSSDLPPAANATELVAPAETPVFSLRRAPQLLTAPHAVEELAVGLDQWVATLPSSSCVAISSGGTTLFSHQPNTPLAPATNLKILTALAALETLGADYTFETRVASLVQPDENGLLNGDLYILGSGDPVLSTDAYLATIPSTFSAVATSADDLADQTIATNIASISGRVLVDDSRYDTERRVATWPGNFPGNGAVGALGAAIIDDGFTGFPQGYTAQVDAVAAGTQPPPLTVANDPAAQFAANFDDLLEARNVVISGGARRSDDTPGEGLIELVNFSSPPVSDIVAQMLTNDDHTTAEMLTKEIGVVNSPPDAPLVGTTSAGTVALSQSLDRLGLSDTGFFPVDGSGLSEASTASCALVHDALAHPTYRELLRAALPLAGRTGALESNFRGTAAEGSLAAEAGRTDRAMGLSGYMTTGPGVEITFALLVNVPEGESLTGQQIAGYRRPLVDLLATYPAGPPLESLGPAGFTPDE